MSDKEKEMETVTAAAENEEESMVIVFKKPYVFEHEEYTEIDRSKQDYEENFPRH